MTISITDDGFGTVVVQPGKPNVQPQVQVTFVFNNRSAEARTAVVMVDHASRPLLSEQNHGLRKEVFKISAAAGESESLSLWIAADANQPTKDVTRYYTVLVIGNGTLIEATIPESGSETGAKHNHLRPRMIVQVATAEDEG